MKLFGGGRVLPVLLLSNLGSSLVEFGESTRDCSPGHAGKEGPHLAMSGESRFSGAAVPVWGFSQGTTGSSGSLSCGVREVKSPYECRGGANKIICVHGITHSEPGKGWFLGKHVPQGLGGHVRVGDSPLFFLGFLKEPGHCQEV